MLNIYRLLSKDEPLTHKDFFLISLLLMVYFILRIPVLATAIV